MMLGALVLIEQLVRMVETNLHQKLLINVAIVILSHFYVTFCINFIHRIKISVKISICHFEPFYVTFCVNFIYRNQCVQVSFCHFGSF